MGIGAKLSDLQLLAERAQATMSATYKRATVRDVYEQFICPTAEKNQVPILEWLNNKPRRLSQSNVVYSREDPNSNHSNSSNTSGSSNHTGVTSVDSIPSVGNSDSPLQNYTPIQSRSFQRGAQMTIVYSMDMLFIDLVDIVTSHLLANEQSPGAQDNLSEFASTTLFWIDILCIRPRCLMIHKSKQEYEVFWADAVEAQMRQTTQTCLILCPWEDKSVFKYSQTLYILYQMYVKQQSIPYVHAKTRTHYHSNAFSNASSIAQFDIWMTCVEDQHMTNIAIEDGEVVRQLWSVSPDEIIDANAVLLKRLYDLPVPSFFSNNDNISTRSNNSNNSFNTSLDSRVKLEWKHIAYSVKEVMHSWLEHRVTIEQTLQSKLKPLMVNFNIARRCFRKGYEHPAFGFPGVSSGNSEILTMTQQFLKCRSIMEEVYDLLQKIQIDNPSSCIRDNAIEFIRLIREVSFQAFVLYEEDPQLLSTDQERNECKLVNALSSSSSTVTYYSVASRILCALCQRWCDWSIRAYGQDHRETLAARAHYGRYHHLVLGDFEMAEMLLEKAISSQRRLLSNTDEDLMQSLMFLGHLQYDLGRYSQSETFLLECLHSRKQVMKCPTPRLQIAGDLEDVRVLDVVLLLASLYNIERRFSLAEEHFERYIYGVNDHFRANSSRYSREMDENSSSPIIYPRLLESLPSYYMSTQNLANLYLVQWKFEKAEPVLRRLLDLHEAAAARNPFLREHFFSTSAKFSPKGNLFDQRRKSSEEGKELSLRANKMVDDLMGEYLSASVALAQCYRRMEKFDVAEAMLLVAIGQTQQYFGEDHPSVRMYRNFYEECVSEAVEWQKEMNDHMKDKKSNYRPVDETKDNFDAKGPPSNQMAALNPMKFESDSSRKVSVPDSAFSSSQSTSQSMATTLYRSFKPVEPKKTAAMTKNHAYLTMKNRVHNSLIAEEESSVKTGMNEEIFQPSSPVNPRSQSNSKLNVDNNPVSASEISPTTDGNSRACVIC